VTTLANLATQTIAESIGEHAARDPQRPAIVGPDFAPFSYGELADRSRHIREQLRHAGIGSSSRVGIALPRGPEAALLSVAMASCTAIVPLNPTLTPTELGQEFARVELDALVLPGWSQSPAWTAAQDNSFGVFHASRTSPSLRDVELQTIRPIPASRRKSGDVSSDSVAVILKTSGTTGAVKLVPVTHRNLLAMASKMRRWFNLSSQDRCGCLLPIHYAQGLKTALLVPLQLGGSVAIPALPDLDHPISWIADLSPTWFSASPTYLQALLDRLRGAGVEKPEHSLRFILSSSTYLPDKVRTELEAMLGIPILEFYGLSEAGIMAANPAPPAKRKPGTAGLPPPDELAIQDQDGRPLPVGQVGEIVVRGPSVTPGYIDNSDGNHTGLRDGWLATGDLGFIDADGFLTIVGRTKELINRGGEKISPYEIEKALLLHPSVGEAAAFSMPHPRLGENVAAAVVLKPGTNATSSDLGNFLFGRLARFKVPQHVFILSSLPRGSTGKITRSDLPAAVASQVRRPALPEFILEFQIAEIWRRLIGRPDIGIDDDFFEAGGDSLQATQMLVEVEALTRQPIPDSALREAHTIRQLAAAVVRAIPSKAELVTCARQGSGTPFFYCHGDYATRGFYALKLADLLGEDQSVFLLHPHREISPGTEITIEAMAQTYIPHLLAIHPSGLFRLGGHCNGGLLAWELAHQLAARGREVEFVVLIETISYNARPAVRAVERGLRLLSAFAPSKSRDRIRIAGMRVVWRALQFGHWLERIRLADRRSLRRSIYKVRGALSEEQRPVPDRPLSGAEISYFRIMSHYVPPKLDSDISCLLSEHNSRLLKFSPKPWKHLAHSIWSEQLPGEHVTCITTYVDELADKLRRLFATGSGVDRVARSSKHRVGRAA
jgi:acyl-CoA synthetase (AMP-forming)/AMP-acid ligase II/thioesterase domain-containing protein/acyl carrier protein